MCGYFGSRTFYLIERKRMVFNVPVKQEIAKNNNSVLLKLENISQSIAPEDIETLSCAIDNEIGNRKLNKEEIEQLQSLMSVDALEASTWKNVADVLKYFSIFAIAENNPEAIKKISNALLTIIGTFYPAAGIAGGLLANVPDRLFSVLIKIGGFASPEYLLYRGINRIASGKAEKAKAQAEDDPDTYENMTTLIIVCKDNTLSTEMSRLIEKEDDVDEDTIVGTKDGTVHTIIWNEPAWQAFRDKLSGDEKILIIGKVKNTTPLNADQIRFEKYGVKYGWSQNIATIEADPKLLSRAKVYKEFLSAINDMQVSEKAKKNAKVKFDWLTAGKLAVFPPLLIGDLLYEDTAVKKQQLVFGLYSLYMQDLDKFLNTKE